MILLKVVILAWKKGNQNHYMLGTQKTYSIIQIAKMFKTKLNIYQQDQVKDLGQPY